MDENAVLQALARTMILYNEVLAAEAALATVNEAAKQRVEQARQAARLVENEEAVKVTAASGVVKQAQQALADHQKAAGNDYLRLFTPTTSMSQVKL